MPQKHFKKDQENDGFLETDENKNNSQLSDSVSEHSDNVASSKENNPVISSCFCKQPDNGLYTYSYLYYFYVLLIIFIKFL